MSGRRGSARSASPTVAAGADGEPEDALRLGPGGHLVEDLLGGDRDQRRQAGRLPEHCVAAHQGEGPAPAGHRDREVEGGDDADHAERVPLLGEPVPGSLGVHLVAVELAGQANREVADVDDLLDLAARLAEDLPVLQADKPGKVLLALAEGVAEPPHDLAAPRRRH